MIKTQREFKALLTGILVGLLLALTVVGFWLYPKYIADGIFICVILAVIAMVVFTIKDIWFDHLPKGGDCDGGRF